jgi:hypothetical protein
MALIAHGGPRRITALLAYLMRPRAVVIQREEPAPPPHYYPPRRDRVIESAAMAREMYRL